MKWYRRISYLLLTIFILSGIGVGLVQSHWGQEKIRSLITSALEKGGVKIEIGTIEGRLPQKLFLKQIQIDLPEGSSLTIESLSAHISLLHFLTAEISFKELIASGIIWKSDTKMSESLLSGDSLLPSLPLSLSVRSFVATDVTVDGVGPLSIKGSLDIGSKRHHLFIDVSAHRGDDKGRLMLLLKKNGSSQWMADIDIQDSSLFNSLYEAPLQGALATKIYSHSEPGKEMEGKFEGHALPKNGSKRVQIPWTFSGKFKHKMGGDWTISKGVLNSDLVKLRASLELDSKGNILEGTGQFESDRLLQEPFKGELLARWLLRREGDELFGKVVAQVPKLETGPLVFKNIELIGNGNHHRGSFTLKGEDWAGGGDYAWDESFQFTNLKLDSSDLKGFGQLEFSPDGNMLGSTELVIENLQILKPFLPEIDPFGKLNVKISGNRQNVKLDMTANSLYLNSFYFEKGALYSDLHDPFNNLTGTVSIDVENGFYKDLHLDSAVFETKIEGEDYPYKIFADGVWSRRFETTLDGFWSLSKKTLTGSIENWKGLFYNHPFSLASPVQFVASPAKTEISNLQIDLAAASLVGRFKKEGDSGNLYLRLDQFPLDFLSLNPLEVSITGSLDFEGQITEVHKKLQGDFKAALKYVEIIELGETHPINAEGMMSGRLDQNKLVFQGALSARDEPLASLDLTLPVRVELLPFKAELLYNKPTSGHFSLNGRIEDFLDFFNLGTHWLEGNCGCDLKWSNTLKNPLLEGHVYLEDGYYENYYTGTQLTDIQADFLAEKDTLFLRTLKAKDNARKGSLLGDGSIRFRVDEKLPFQVHLAFKKFNFIQVGFIGAEADGAIDVKGDIQSAIAYGQIHVMESDISIPENLTKSPPNLQVVYKNAQKPPQFIQTSSYKPYPLHLDLQVDTPKGIVISGRGLESKWKGNFHLGGTYTSPQPKGNLELIQGEFNFSGRAFKLSRGVLSFSGGEKEMPHLDLTGALEQQGISIIANLQGPLNSPQLTFQSSPPLPLSAIIAHLLFGQDISEINGLQALQLATSVAKIAGESPDVLETTRKSLGIDRLRIISAPNAEGGESVAIQVGKYVAKGVIVSISQSAENSAPNISIEVDIGSGFYFQAESDQIHEQGKFAVKWNRNY